MKIVEKAKKSEQNIIASMNEAADKLKEKGNYKQEIETRKKIVVRMEEQVEQFGEGKLEMLQAMSDLAAAYENLYQFDKAIATREDTLERCRKWFDEYDAETALSMSLLSNTLNRMGKYCEALAYDYEVYMRRLSLYGPDGEETLSAVMNYASSFADVGEYNTAMFFYKQNYEDIVRIYGKNSPEAYERLEGIATVLNDLEHYKDALSLWEKVEDYNRQRFGKKAEQTFDAMRKVALTLNYLGQHEEAKRRLEKVLEKETREFGHELLITKSVLSRVLLKTGNYNRAINLLEELLKKRRQIYGEKHPAFALILNRLAYAYHLKGDVEKERGCVGKLEQILEDGLIENTEHKIKTQDTLVRLYVDLREYEKAAALTVKMTDAAEYHYFYKKGFLADRYDTAKLAFEKAGDPEKAKEYEYKKTHMDELIHSGKPLCGMKLKAKEDEEISLTKGKIYELLGTEEQFGETLYSIIDDEEFVPYLYAPEQFEVVEGEEEEPFVLYKDTEKVVEFQQIPLCDYNDMKATILEDGTFHISGVDETWKGLAFMTFDDDGYDNDDYDFDYEFTKKATKELFALLLGKDPNEVKTDADLKELLNLDVIQKRFASEEGVDKLFEFCRHYGIQYTRRNY